MSQVSPDPAGGRRWPRFPGGPVWLQVVLWAAALALLGEVKVYLYPDSAFRFTLAPVGLAFALTAFPRLPALPAGAAAGAAVFLLRTGIALALQGGGWAALPEIARRFWPAAAYYVSQSAWLQGLRVRDHLRAGRPLLLVGSLLAADVLSNLLELALRPDRFTGYALAAFALVGAGRAAVVAGLCLAVKGQETEWRHAREREEYRRLLLLLTGLQAEIFFLRKSSAEIEQIMVRAHTLHRRLKGDPELAPLALDVAKDVHEVKKDYQRILAGLERLLKVRALEPDMAFSEIVTLVFDANRGYAARLGKEIAFTAGVKDDFRTPAYTLWVSVLNNLITNAVEAIPQQGEIAVTAGREGGRYVVRVRDTGTGIPPADWELIFSPGYSTKSDPATGEFSTGLGLAHAAGLMAALGGTIRIERSGPDGTVFRLETQPGG